MSTLNSRSVAIWDDRGVRGSGIVISGGLVLTCAHVVNDVLRRPRNAAEPPAAVINVKFPSLQLEGSARVATNGWFPVLERPKGGQVSDLAILELDGGGPDEGPIALLEVPDSRAQLEIEGFPPSYEDGTLAQGEFLAIDGAGRLQLMITADRMPVRAGFSGGPIYLSRTGVLTGLVSEVEDVGAGRQLVRGLSASMLQDALRTQDHQTSPFVLAAPGATDRTGLLTDDLDEAVRTIRRIPRSGPVPNQHIHPTIKRRLRSITAPPDMSEAWNTANFLRTSADPSIVADGIVIPVPGDFLHGQPIILWDTMLAQAAVRGGRTLFSLILSVPSSLAGIEPLVEELFERLLHPTW